MTELIVLILVILMAAPSTTINVKTKWLEYEYSAKRMYRNIVELFKKF